MSEERAGRVTDLALLVFALSLPFSIAVSEIALGIVLLAWLWTRPWRRAIVPRSLVVLTGVLVGTWLLATATAADPWASLVRVRKIYSILLLFVVADRARDPRRAARLAGVALCAGAANALFGIALFVWVRLGGLRPGYRLESNFSTAMTTGNVYATLAVAAVGELLLSGRGRLRRILAWPAVILLVPATIATLTRSSWLALLAGGGLLLALLRPRWLLASVLGAVLLFAFGPAELRGRAGQTFDPAYETNAGRISLWRSGLAVVRDHPWTGVGLADHYALIERYRRADATFHAGHFHNNYVQIAASTGLVGLSAYTGWMLLVAFLLARGARAPGGGRALVGLAVWLAFQVHGMFDWSFGDAEVANQFFLWVGLGLARRGGPEPGENRAIPSSPAAPPVPPLSGPAPAA